MATSLQFQQFSATNERAGRAFAPPPPALTKLPVVEARMADLRLCSVAECSKPAVKRRLCNAHYLRAWRHGDPLAGAAAKGVTKEFLSGSLAHQGEECLIWPFAKHESGCAVRNERGRVVRVPREVCRLTHGEPPAPHYQAAHSCGNGHLGCVNPRHLRWATPADNNLDKIGHGTHSRGRHNPSNVLSEAEVRQIRSISPDQATFAATARRFGVSASTVRDIARRRTWAWLA